MNINLSDEKINKEDLRSNISFFRNTRNKSYHINLTEGIVFKELLNEENEMSRYIQSSDGRLIMCERVLI